MTTRKNGGGRHAYDEPLELEPIDLPLHTEVLDNGLRVIVHPRLTAPVAVAHAMVHVGSRHEPADRTGIAHLLEHLLFEGSAHCPKGEYDTLLERVGGGGNGSTWWDRTNYYEVVPTSALELALWLERERFLHTFSEIDEAIVGIQRDVVLNERLQVYDNRPYGQAEEAMQRTLFPAGHPYRHPTIGYAEHISAYTLDDAHRFFDRWYRPANMVLVVAGDVRVRETVELVDRYLGALPAGASPEAPAPHVPGEEYPPAARTDDVSIADQVTLARAYLGWRVPAYGTDAWVALDVLGYLLSDGETSALHHALVRESRMAVSADAYLYPSEIEGMFGVTITGRVGVSASALRDAALEVITRIAREGVPLVQLRGAIRRARRDQVEALATVEERAEALAYAALTLGDVTHFPRLLERYAELTPDEIIAAARRLAGSAPATVLVHPDMEEA